MSSSTFKERLPDYRNQYARLKAKAAKGRFATRLCETFGFERKYLLKLLNGIRRYQPPRGRAATYGLEVERATVKLRRAAGWPCAPYFKEMLPKILPDWEALNGPFDAGVREALLRISSASLGRIFKRHPALWPRHGNRRSGCHKQSFGIPACPGKAIEDGRPGVFQVQADFRQTKNAIPKTEGTGTWQPESAAPGRMLQEYKRDCAPKGDRQTNTQNR